VSVADVMGAARSKVSIVIHLEGGGKADGTAP
jgi:hypothetical protein